MQKIPNLEAMGRAIRDARKGREWTQTELARRAGCQTATISQLENAKTRMPLDLVLAVLGALDLQLSLGPRPTEPDAAPWEL